MTVPYIDLIAQHTSIKAELLRETDRVLSHGGFILGDEVAAFEAEFAQIAGTRFAISVANGTDAIVLALRGLGIGAGDEVITAPNSFLASASGIALTGARPVFVDVGEDYNLDPSLLEQAVTPRTRAILPVHLTGRPAPMREILEIALRHQIAVVEDAAQAVSARYEDRPVGTWGQAACFSLHPLKNLSACGDGGVITTNDPDLDRYLRLARNHGLKNRDECEFWSVNSRLDAIQAAWLRVKLKFLPAWTARRRQHASEYRRALSKCLTIPPEQAHEHCVYHTFVVQTPQRDELQRFLESRGIGTKIHYPIPIHRQPAAAALGYQAGDFPVAELQSQRILSLPIYPELTDAQRDYVIENVLTFFGASSST